MHGRPPRMRPFTGRRRAVSCREWWRCRPARQPVRARPDHRRRGPWGREVERDRRRCTARTLAGPLRRHHREDRAEQRAPTPPRAPARPHAAGRAWSSCTGTRAPRRRVAGRDGRRVGHRQQRRGVDQDRVVLLARAGAAVPPSAASQAARSGSAAAARWRGCQRHRPSAAPHVPHSTRPASTLVSPTDRSKPRQVGQLRPAQIRLDRRAPAGRPRPVRSRGSPASSSCPRSASSS